MNWDYKQWSALAAAADSGSFEQAAQQLNITASAVSKRIRDLEDAVGAVLLTRARPCRPTAEGQRMLRYWRQMVSLQQALENELSELLASKVAVQHGRGGRGKLVIHYGSLEALDGVIDRLRKPA